MRHWTRLVPALALIFPLLISVGHLAAQEAVPARAWYVGKILFKSDRGGKEAFYAMNSDGSEVQLVQDPNVGFYYAEALQRDMTSPDGRYRLFVNQFGGDYQIWEQDTVTGAQRYVIGGTEGADYDPAWAPDTRWLAYVSQADGNDEIHLFDRQTGLDKRLTSNSWEWDKHPSWSPDGKQIVFWSNREAEWKHIWVMNADGSQQHNLSGWGKYNDWDPVWVKQLPSAPSPVDLAVITTPVAKRGPGCTPQPADYVGKIVFKSDREGVAGFYLMDPESGDVCRIDDRDIGFYYAEAAVRDATSADGHYRLIVRLVGSDYQIWEQDTVTGAQRYVIGGTEGADYDPAWAPDTRWLAYVSQADGNDEIHLFDRQTGLDKRLTSNSWEWDKHPSWSPDGKQIVFWSNRETQWKHLWLMNSDGSNQHNLSGTGNWNDWDPIWMKAPPSPAPVLSLPTPRATVALQEAKPLPRQWYVGKILFKSDRGGKEAFYAMNSDGSEVQLVQDPNVGFYYAEALQRDMTSPDGRYRLFVNQFGGDYQIWEQDTVTGAQRYVIGGTEGADYDPAWAPDTRWLAYVSQADGNDEIHLFDRQTGLDKRLTSNSWEWDKHPSWSPDGKQIVFWSNREAEWKHIWVMNADGSQQHNLSGWGKYNDWDPVWVKQLPSAR